MAKHHRRCHCCSHVLGPQRSRRSGTPRRQDAGREERVHRPCRSRGGPARARPAGAGVRTHAGPWRERRPATPDRGDRRPRPRREASRAGAGSGFHSNTRGSAAYGRGRPCGERRRPGGESPSPRGERKSPRAPPKRNLNSAEVATRREGRRRRLTPQPAGSRYATLRRPAVFPGSRSRGRRRCNGEWLSLVEHLVRDQGVAGSNPVSPTQKAAIPRRETDGTRPSSFPDGALRTTGAPKSRDAGCGWCGQCGGANAAAAALLVETGRANVRDARHAGRAAR